MKLSHSEMKVDPKIAIQRLNKTKTLRFPKVKLKHWIETRYPWKSKFIENRKYPANSINAPTYKYY